MFQMAMLTVSSSFDDGIFAASMRSLRTRSPCAISGLTGPWCIRSPPGVLSVGSEAPSPKRRRRQTLYHSLPPSPKISLAPRLLDRDGLGEVAGLVHVAAASD